MTTAIISERRGSKSIINIHIYPICHIIPTINQKLSILFNFIFYLFHIFTRNFSCKYLTCKYINRCTISITRIKEKLPLPCPNAAIYISCWESVINFSVLLTNPYKYLQQSFQLFPLQTCLSR